MKIKFGGNKYMDKLKNKANDVKEIDMSETVDKKAKKQKLIKIPKIIKIILTSICLIAIFTLIFVLGMKYNDRILHHDETTESIQFKNVGELVTQTAFVKEIEDSSKNRTLFNSINIPFTESRKIFSYMVEVDASINFEEITYEIDDSDKIIKIKLPHARVYKSTLDENSFYSYLDSESIFTNINDVEANELRKMVKANAEKDAIDNGLLEKADENGKIIIENMVKTNDKYRDYEFEFEYIGGLTNG